MMPISCIECRRRKIKCNKLTPCNQCVIRSRECEYPPKFRSIKVESLILDQPNPLSTAAASRLTHSEAETDAESIATTSASILPSSSNLLELPTDLHTGEQEMRPQIKRSASSKARFLSAASDSASSRLISPELKGSKRRNDDLENHFNCHDKESIIMDLRKENEVLKLKLKDMRLKNKRQKDKLETDDVEVDNDTNEANDNALDNNSGTNSSIYYGPNSTRFMISSALTKSDVNEFDNFIKVKRQIKLKRELPMLYNPSSTRVTVGSSSPLFRISNETQLAKNRTSAKSKSQENVKLIISLLNKFFHLRQHYLNYLEQEPLINFLNNYPSAKIWKNDDDILLEIIMILIVALRSLPPSDPLLVEHELEYKKIRPLLYKQYKNLKNGMQVETTISLRAYILECEDLFYNDQIERSWSLLFKTVSTAYSLGLHVYDENIVNTLKLEEHDKALDVVRTNSKASLWFVISFVSATLCSVLGRPNPVTFNFQPLLRNYEIRLNYKMALTDLVKKSTNVLIESYKVQISFDTILEIDESFVNEALIYEKILIDTRIMRDLKSRDDKKSSFITLPVIDNKKGGKRAGKSNSFKSLSQLNLNKVLSDCPLDIRFTILRPCPNCDSEEPFCLLKSDCDTLSDLILLYGNRAKFHQHFMSTYKKSLESCLDSILKVLDHSLEINEQLLKRFERPMFQSLYPFFFTFLYQTFVVIYTLMHLGYGKLFPYYNEIGLIRQKLIRLFETVGLENWRPNVIRIIQYINDMCISFFKIYLDKEQQQSSTTRNNLEKGDPVGILPLHPPPPPPPPQQQEQDLVHYPLGQSQSVVQKMMQQQCQQLQQQQPQQQQQQRSMPFQSQQQCHGQQQVKTPFNFGIAPFGESPKPSGNVELQPTTPRLQSLPSFCGIQLHNIPEHISGHIPHVPRETQESQITHSQSHHNQHHQLQRLSNIDFPKPSPGSSRSLPFPPQGQHLFYSNNTTSLSQLSLFNYNLEYYNPSQQLFPISHSAQDNGGNYEVAENGDSDTVSGPVSTFTIDPLLGFDLSDPFFVQNPSNFSYTGQVADLKTTGNGVMGSCSRINTATTNDDNQSVDSNEKARPEAIRINSNDSNEFLSYIGRDRRSESAGRTANRD